MYLLLVTTLLGFLSIHSDFITKRVIKWNNKLSGKERELVQQKFSLMKELSDTSQVRDFPKYSKLQRKINTLNKEIGEHRNNRSTNSIAFNMGINYGFKVAFGVIMLFFVIYYRQVPVFALDSKYNLFPFTGLISYPTKLENGVSVHFWMFCCTSIAKLIKLKA